MTTYILHGGSTQKDTPSNLDFFRIMAQSVPADGTWLGCYFSVVQDSEVTRKFHQDCEKLRHADITHPVNFVCATVKDFPEQIAKADVVYFRGGSTTHLMQTIRQWPDLPQWLKKCKTVAGSSAGMNMLGRDYVTRNGFGEGLNLIPMGMVVHHKASEYQASQTKLHERHRPLLLLHETQFCVIEM